MDPVTSLSQLMRTLRQQMSAKTHKSKHSAKQNSPTLTESLKKSTANRASLEEVQMRIRERVKQLGPGKNDSQQAAQIFVESILMWEFGPEILQDPRFQEMSKEVQATMMNDPDTWERFRGLLLDL